MCPPAQPLFAKTDFEKQTKLLKHAIGLLLSFPGQPRTEPGVLSRVAERHSRRDHRCRDRDRPQRRHNLQRRSQRDDRQRHGDRQRSASTRSSRPCASSTPSARRRSRTPGAPRWPRASPTCNRGTESGRLDASPPAARPNRPPGRRGARGWVGGPVAQCPGRRRANLPVYARRRRDAAHATSASNVTWMSRRSRPSLRWHATRGRWRSRGGNRPPRTGRTSPTATPARRPRRRRPAPGVTSGPTVSSAIAPKRPLRRGITPSVFSPATPRRPTRGRPRAVTATTSGASVRAATPRRGWWREGRCGEATTMPSNSSSQATARRRGRVWRRA